MVDSIDDWWSAYVILNDQWLFDQTNSIYLIRQCRRIQETANSIFFFSSCARNTWRISKMSSEGPGNFYYHHILTTWSVPTCWFRQSIRSTTRFPPMRRSTSRTVKLFGGSVMPKPSGFLNIIGHSKPVSARYAYVSFSPDGKSRTNFGFVYFSESNWIFNEFGN